MTATFTIQPGMGAPIDAQDKKGAPIHVGDVLQFDSDVWYRHSRNMAALRGEPRKPEPPVIFQIEMKDGELHHNGVASDFPEYCTIVKTWTAVMADQGDAQALAVNASIRALRNDSAGNQAATMTEIDTAADLLEGLLAELQAARTEVCRVQAQRNELLSALEAVMGHLPDGLLEGSEHQVVATARATIAKAKQ